LPVRGHALNEQKALLCLRQPTCPASRPEIWGFVANESTIGSGWCSSHCISLCWSSGENSATRSITTMIGAATVGSSKAIRWGWVHVTLTPGTKLLQRPRSLLGTLYPRSEHWMASGPLTGAGGSVHPETWTSPFCKESRTEVSRRRCCEHFKGVPRVTR
jgi:hypothetical protein